MSDATPSRSVTLRKPRTILWHRVDRARTLSAAGTQPAVTGAEPVTSSHGPRIMVDGGEQ